MGGDLSHGGLLGVLPGRLTGIKPQLISRSHGSMWMAPRIDTLRGPAPGGRTSAQRSAARRFHRCISYEAQGAVESTAQREPSRSTSARDCSGSPIVRVGQRVSFPGGNTRDLRRASPKEARGRRRRLERGCPKGCSRASNAHRAQRPRLRDVPQPPASAAACLSLEECVLRKRRRDRLARQAAGARYLVTGTPCALSTKK